MLSQRAGDILNRHEALAISTVFTNTGLQGSEQLLRFTFPTYVMEVQLTVDGEVVITEYDTQNGRSISETHSNVLEFVRAYSYDHE